jgi:hypothetical protein
LSKDIAIDKMIQRILTTIKNDKGKDAIVVEYFVSTNKIYIFIVTADAIEIEQVDCKESELLDLTPQKISNILTTCKSHKLLDEVEPVIDVAWRAGFDLYVVTPERMQIKSLAEDLDVLKDWKLALAEASHRY